MILSILICEDDPVQRKNIERVVSDYLALKDYDAKLCLSTDDPLAVLGYVEANPKQSSLYILDVDLQHKLNGITLAQKIREYDPFGWIIFVTSHAEMSALTFRYRVEAMDYIVKDDAESVADKVRECIDIAYRLSTSTTQYFQIKSNEGIQNVPFDTIMFFESSLVPHKLILHTHNERIEFRGKMKNITGPDFFQCHKSYIVNVKNIKRINKAEKTVVMTNGETAMVTPKKLAGLIAAMCGSNGQ